MARPSLGSWAGIAYCTLNGVYLAVLTAMMVSGVGFPPPEPLRTVFHVLLLSLALTAVPLWCGVHLAAPPSRQGFTLTSLAFIVMFATAVIINRFVALTMVRQSPGLGQTDGLEWFEPYGWPSVTFALEILGWGLFYSLACLLLVPVFATGAGRLGRALAVAFAVTGLTGLGGVVGLAVNSVELMGVVAPVAWGVGPIVAIALLVRWLRRTSVPQATAGGTDVGAHRDGQATRARATAAVHMDSET